MSPIPLSSVQSDSRLGVIASWKGVIVECLQPDFHALDAHSGVVVNLAIAHQPIDSPLLKNHLHLTITPSAIDPNLAEQIRVPLPFQYSQQIRDRSILHLLQLLQTEMQTPQPMSQIIVSSIATVLTTYLLQHWQAEQDKN